VLHDEISLQRWVQARLSPTRYAHTVRVAATACGLASVFGAELRKTQAAAWLHDCARDMPKQAQLRQAGAFGIVIADVERHNPALLHAPLGAELARRECGVHCESVLDAVRYHTTGRAGMSLLEKVVFVADYIEPERRFRGADRVREVALLDLDTAVLLALDQTIAHVLERAQLLHPNTLEARNDLILQRIKREGRE
jgi:predicted HD superfamily hydrolase involved in NAD metabolism